MKLLTQHQENIFLASEIMSVGTDMKGFAFDYEEIMPVLNLK